MKGKNYITDRELGLTYEEIGEKHGTTSEAVRSAIRRYQTKKVPVSYPPQEPENEFIKIEEDGTQTHSKVINIKPDEMSDAETVIRKFDLNPAQWRLKECSFSKWGKEGDYRYSTRIKVEPKKIGALSTKEILDAFIAGIPALPEKKIVPMGEMPRTSLVIPLFDLHFQQSTDELKNEYEHSYFNKIEQHLEQNTYREIYIILGGDALEHDNFVFTTEKGTRTGDTDLVADMLNLQWKMENLLWLASTKAEKVYFDYVRGNHSPSTDWAVSNALHTRFRNTHNISFDLDESSLLKGKLIGHVFVGAYHGHRTIKAGGHTGGFSLRFPQLWADSETKLILTGHYHSESEIATDESTCLVHRQPSPKPSNQWAENRNYLSHFSGVKLYELNDSCIEKVHYIGVY